MSKTKFEKIKEQQRKARDKEILYRVKKILKREDDNSIEILKDIVGQLHVYGRIKHIENYLFYGYKIRDTATGNEVTNDE